MAVSFNELQTETAKIFDDFFPLKNCFIEVNPGGIIMPRKYEPLGESILNLPVYDDDIWLISYPRTGSTWAQEMIWLLGNNFDYEGAKQMQQVRSPLIELSGLFGEDHGEWVASSIGNTVEYVRDMPRPRFARSHLPWHLLPKQFSTVKPKIIYTSRNPKDLCVSFYHYCQLLHGLSGTFDDFCELFITGRSPIGSYWKHVLPFWERRNDSNILFLKYEDMKRNLPDIIQKCAKFLNVNTLNQSELDRMCEHLKFDKMQSNPAVNLEPLINNLIPFSQSENGKKKFIRKGQIGDWNNYITPGMSNRFDEWIDLNSSGTGLSFEYE